MKASSLVHACENPWATVRMAQLCSVMRQLPSGSRLRLGQVAVLVEDGGQRGDLLVEGEVGGAGERAGDAAPATLLEELVDLAGVGPAEVPEQLGREVAVALRVERLGRRRQLVDVAGPASPGSLGHLVVVHEQAVLLEARQLQADGGRRQRERLGHGDRVERSLALDQVEDGPPRRRQLLDGRLVAFRPAGSRSWRPRCLAVAASSSRQDQVDVAELVPQVALGERGLVGRLEQRPSGDRLEHGEVRRLRLVPSGEEPVDGAHRSLG